MAFACNHPPTLADLNFCVPDMGGTASSLKFQAPNHKFQTRVLSLGLFVALVLLACGIDARQIEHKKPSLSMVPDFEVVDIEFNSTHHIFAKIRNNSSSPFSGNVEMALQIAGYGLV